LSFFKYCKTFDAIAYIAESFGQKKKFEFQAIQCTLRQLASGYLHSHRYFLAQLIKLMRMKYVHLEKRL
jgi:hypothetical protein